MWLPALKFMIARRPMQYVGSRVKMGVKPLPKCDCTMQAGWELEPSFATTGSPDCLNTGIQDPFPLYQHL